MVEIADLLTYSFFRNALFGILLVSIASAIIGTYIVTRRMVFISGGITHACFGGLGVGYYLSISPVVMAGVFAVASALGVEWLSTRNRVREDSAIGVVWALGMAIGTVFIFLSPGYVPELSSFLFGNILTITHDDLLAFSIFLVLLALFFILFFRTIITCAFDSDFAKTIHLPVSIINGVMTVSIALCIVLTIRMMGVMLLMSLFTLPQMSAEVFTKKFATMMILAAIISATSGIIGLIFAAMIEVPASAAIVIVLTIMYFASRCVNAIKRHLSAL